MLISDFDYELPEELIAQHPLERRDASRMLVVERGRGAWRDSSFGALASEIGAGDVLVLNNTRVFPARLQGRREPSGGRVELLLVRRTTNDDDDDAQTWETLARPARRLERGARVTFGDGRLRGEVLETQADGRRVVRFSCAGDFNALL
ncbi:MAG TPA: S-adenosylmethionine:tRNA ribosyltransferase-isomerase, partial [Pyrinomonadaceae bacterium]|nr:S-adenosylmethionine:tRNA ribosyltransferase-isomerase [Pyrinomonadaceae bacterium]